MPFRNKIKVFLKFTRAKARKMLLGFQLTWHEGRRGGEYEYNSLKFNSLYASWKKKLFMNIMFIKLRLLPSITNFPKITSDKKSPP